MLRGSEKSHREKKATSRTTASKNKNVKAPVP